MSRISNIRRKENPSYFIFLPTVYENRPDDVRHLVGENSYLFKDENLQFDGNLYVKFKGNEIRALPIEIKQSDLDLFLLGKYSRLSHDLKTKVIKFHESQSHKIRDSTPLENIKSIFYPKNENFQELSDYFGVTFQLMKEVGEVMAIVDPLKEVLNRKQKWS